MKNKIKQIGILMILITIISVSPARATMNLAKHFTKAQLAEANTAGEANYLAEEEKRVIQYLNLARIFPLEFASFYIEYLQENDTYGYNQFKKKDKYYYSLYQDLLRLKEKNRKVMMPNLELHEYAKCWAIESGEKGVIGHNRKKCAGSYFAECCGYMHSQDAMKHVLLLLVDEDVPGVGHREVMFDDYEVVGVSIQKHTKYGHVLVMDFYGEDPNKNNYVDEAE